MNLDEEILDVLFGGEASSPFDSPEKETDRSNVKTSYEQQLAIHSLLDGQNGVVDSVSGSGKSTTILAAAEQMPNSRILQLTFNAMLRKEVQEKVKTRGLKHLVVHTYHSLAVLYYHKDAHKDMVMRKILNENRSPRKKIPKYDVVFLDEAQDMTMLYYMFIIKFLRNMGSPFQLFVLGDYKQGIYQFKGADIRFLTKARDIWSGFPLLKTDEFRECRLSMSYRITNQMADFVNQVMLGAPRLRACREGSKVKYIRNSRVNLEKMVIYYVRSLLEAGSLPSDIFILAASVKKGSIRKMENALVERNIPCYVPVFETEQIDEKVIDGKVVFSTFHSVKGRERKHVFVMGFDHTYFPYYASELPVDECPNTLYVAATRATENLFLLEIDQFQTDRPLDFLQLNHFEMRDAPYVDFRGTPQKYFELAENSRDATNRGEYHDVSPTSLIKFVNETVVEKIAPGLDRIFLVEREPTPENEIAIPIMIQTRRGFHEDVSDLNGIAIPSIYYDYLYRKYTGNGEEESSAIPPFGAAVLLQMISRAQSDWRENEHAFLRKTIAELPASISTPEDYLFLSNVFVAVQEKLYFKIKQIEREDYGWLSQSVVETCLARLDETVGRECVVRMEEESSGDHSGDHSGEMTEIFSVPLAEEVLVDLSMEFELEKIQAVLSPYFPDTPKKFRFSARTDLITEHTLWELKCTTTLSMEHQLQVVVYAWLWRILHPESPRKVCLLNIRTGELQTLHATLEELTFIVVELLKGKYENPAVKTDEEFVRACREYMESPTPGVDSDSRDSEEEWDMGMDMEMEMEMEMDTEMEMDE